MDIKAPFVLTRMKALTNGLSGGKMKIRQAQEVTPEGRRRIFILIPGKIARYLIFDWRSHSTKFDHSLRRI